MVIKDTYTINGDGDLSLTTTGYFRLQELMDVTNKINQIADDDHSVRLKKIRLRLDILSAIFGVTFGIAILKVPKSATISTTQSTVNQHLEIYFNDAINDEFQLKILNKVSFPKDYSYDGSTCIARYTVSGTYSCPKNLWKIGHGGISDEHDPSVQDKFELKAYSFIYIRPAPAATLPALYRFSSEIQYELIDRKRLTSNL